MSYSAAELASFTPALREKTDAVLVLLDRFADVATTPDQHELAADIERIARTFELVGFRAERDAIISAFKALDLYVGIRCRHHRDANSSFSIPNYYPEGHKFRRSYEVRVAAEKRDLEGFPVARERILATARVRLSGTVLDSTLARMRAEPLTAPVVVEAVNLLDAMEAA